MKTALVSVINDLSTDQRVDKVCGTLTGLSFRVVLIGRKKRDSLLLEDRSYKMHRMRLLFEKGPLFYAEFNIRLFVYLLIRRTDLLVSNDLDTLLPNYLIHRMKGVPLVYDSHELFTETPEVIHRKFVRNTWERG
ncbi:MAG: glycosyltransferase, partial [Bacteroidetes bacterium]|nr:glycosyltransferase [Bacteroidota bacterium]